MKYLVQYATYDLLLISSSRLIRWFSHEVNKDIWKIKIFGHLPFCFPIRHLIEQLKFRHNILITFVQYSYKTRWIFIQNKIAIEIFDIEFHIYRVPRQRFQCRIFDVGFPTLSCKFSLFVVQPTTTSNKNCLDFIHFIKIFRI